MTSSSYASAIVRLPSVAELLSDLPLTHEPAFAPPTEAPCSHARTTDQVERDPRMTCAVSPTYTPYTSPYSTYAGYGPNLVGGSSWSTRSPGLSERLRRTTLESSPGTGESYGRRLSPSLGPSTTYSPMLHSSLRSPGLHPEHSLPSSNVSPETCSYPLAPTAGLLPSPALSTASSQYHLPMHIDRFPSAVPIAAPSALGLTSSRIRTSRHQQPQIEYLSRGPSDAGPSALGLGFHEPLTTTELPDWMDQDVVFSSEILVGLANSKGVKQEMDEDLMFESSDEELDSAEDDCPPDLPSPVTTVDSRDTRLPSPIAIPSAHKRTSRGRRQSTFSISSVNSDTSYPQPTAPATRKRAASARVASRKSSTSVGDERSRRPFGCEYCQERFMRKNDYNRHRRIHTGERPYHCPSCDQGFMRNDALLRHLSHSKTCAASAPSRDEFVFSAGAPKKRKGLVSISLPSTSTRGSSTRRG